MFKIEFIQAAKNISLEKITLLETEERKYYRSEFVLKTCLKRKMITLPQAKRLKLFIKYACNDLYDKTDVNSWEERYTKAVTTARSVMIASDYYQDDEIIPETASILEAPEQADLNLIFALEILLIKDLYQNHVLSVVKKIIEGDYENLHQIYNLLSEYPLSYSQLEDPDTFPLLDYAIDPFHIDSHESYSDWKERVLG